jgi:ABC-type sugar transport system permease subunit
MKRARLQSSSAPYVLLAPFVGLFAIFIAYPLVQSLVLSTQQTFGPGYSRFIGLSNYAFLIHDALFWKALANTAIFTAGSVFIQLPLALGLALLLNNPRIRGRIFFRTIFFAPVLVGIVFVALLFRLILEKRTGLLNVVLHSWFPSFNLDFPWLQEWAMVSMIIAALWMFVGFNMVYFLAALQNVRQDLVEAAMIDGAGPWQRFLNVTVPAIKPVATFVVLLSIVGSFQLFEMPWVMFPISNGSGYNNNALTVVMYLYKSGFDSGDLGYASTIGWAMTIILMVFALAQLLIARHEERSLG